MRCASVVGHAGCCRTELGVLGGYWRRVTAIGRCGPGIAGIVIGPPGLAGVKPARRPGRPALPPQSGPAQALVAAARRDTSSTLRPMTIDNEQGAAGGAADRLRMDALPRPTLPGRPRTRHPRWRAGRRCPRPAHSVQHDGTEGALVERDRIRGAFNPQFRLDAGHESSRDWLAPSGCQPGTDNSRRRMASAKKSRNAAGLQCRSRVSRQNRAGSISAHTVSTAAA